MHNKYAFPDVRTKLIISTCNKFNKLARILVKADPLGNMNIASV